MPLMLAIAEFHVDDSFPNPELDKFLNISQPDYAS